VWSGGVLGRFLGIFTRQAVQHGWLGII
jgi:hypothetical protein